MSTSSSHTDWCNYQQLLYWRGCIAADACKSAHGWDVDEGECVCTSRYFLPWDTTHLRSRWLYLPLAQAWKGWYTMYMVWPIINTFFVLLNLTIRMRRILPNLCFTQSRISLIISCGHQTPWDKLILNISVLLSELSSGAECYLPEKIAALWGSITRKKYW